MARSYLLVHSFSYGYVTSVVDYIHSQLKAHLPFPVEFAVCDHVDAIKFDNGSVIFALGMFGKFSRSPTCSYVYLNVERLYPRGPYSAAARRWAQRKKQRFDQKVRFYDFVLEWHTDQVALVMAEFGVPARFFPICMAPPKPRDRIYDVCLVGSRTPRRVTIEKRLSRLGVRLSPSTGIMLEDAAAQSRIVLNVHAYRSSNIELPRMIGAMMAGAALVTEPSPGVERYLPPHLYLVASYRELVDSIFSLLGQPERVKTIAWLRVHG